MYAVLVAVCGALAGCGKSSHTAPALVTKAQGLAYADTVNLNETDVPGWTRRSSGGEVKISRAAVEGARCAGAVDPHRLLVNRYSPIYHQQQGGSMQSYILVWPTATLADKNAKALLSARGIACFTREQPHEHNYKEAGVVVRQVLKSISRLPDPLPHAAYSFE